MSWAAEMALSLISDLQLASLVFNTGKNLNICSVFGSFQKSVCCVYSGLAGMVRLYVRACVCATVCLCGCVFACGQRWVGNMDHCTHAHKSCFVKCGHCPLSPDVFVFVVRYKVARLSWFGEDGQSCVCACVCVCVPAGVRARVWCMQNCSLSVSGQAGVECACVSAGVRPGCRPLF